jgi:hypothetical protein
MRTAAARRMLDLLRPTVMRGARAATEARPALALASEQIPLAQQGKKTMEILIIMLAVGALGLLANRFGYDSRDCFPEHGR